MKRYGWFSILAFCFLLLILSLGFDHTAIKNNENDKKRVEESIAQAALTCYSIEGFYPKDIAYLETNYHLNLDMKRYQVHYEWIASNIRPDIFVFTKGDE